MDEVLPPAGQRGLEQRKVYFTSQALQIDLPMQPITPSEIADVIAKQNTKKTLGHDTISNSITLLFNAMVRLLYFPPQYYLHDS